MQADHFDQQKLLALAAEDVALAQLAHRRRTLPENAAVAAAEEAQRTLSSDVVRAETDYTAEREDPSVRDLPDPLASVPGEAPGGDSRRG